LQESIVQPEVIKKKTVPFAVLFDPHFFLDTISYDLLWMKNFAFLLKQKSVIPILQARP
jgi:hypothetical protein